MDGRRSVRWVYSGNHPCGPDERCWRPKHWQWEQKRGPTREVRFTLRAYNWHNVRSRQEKNWEPLQASGWCVHGEGTSWEVNHNKGQQLVRDGGGMQGQDDTWKVHVIPSEHATSPGRHRPWITVDSAPHLNGLSAWTLLVHLQRSVTSPGGRFVCGQYMHKKIYSHIKKRGRLKNWTACTEVQGG